MIVKTTLAISAEHPNLPLDTAATFVGSAVTFSITGVPALPAISVAAVSVSVTNADGAVSTVAAVSGEDGWTATFPASHFAAAGTVKDGVVVAVSGTDENGAARTWTAGVGAIVILSSSPVPAPSEVVYNLRLHDAEPDAPTDGDVWPDGDGGYLLWQDGEAHALGGSSVTVDDELSTTSENPVQNKVVTEAVNTRPTKAQIDEGWWSEWVLEFYESGEWVGIDDPTIAEGIASATISYDENDEWELTIERTDGDIKEYTSDDGSGNENAEYLGFKIFSDDVNIRATRHRVAAPVPTKPSDIGAQAALSAQQLSNIAAVPNKANSADVAAALALKADAASLPYALVGMQLSAWMYSWPEGATGSTFEAQYSNGTWIFDNPDNDPISVTAAEDAMSLTFTAADVGGIYYTVTATRGYQLTDRAINAVSISADATLVFPAQTTGKARDFVVRLTLTETNDVVPSVTFPADVPYETEGGEWPDLTEAGTYIVRLTEVPKASESETARFFLQCSSAVADATPPSAGGGQ